MTEPLHLGTLFGLGLAAGLVGIILVVTAYFTLYWVMDELYGLAQRWRRWPWKD